METQPPKAKTIPHTFSHLEWEFTDLYAWLEDKNDPEVIAYLEAENRYAKAALAHTGALQETLFQEMKGRIVEDDEGVPVQRGAYFYYWRMEAGKQYRIFCRKRGSLDAPEQILLDENQLAEGKTYCRVLDFEPSPDQTRLAYSVDTTGAWVFDLYVLDMETGERLSGPIPNTAWGTAWADDSATLFYTIFDHAHRPYQLYRHRVGYGLGEEGSVLTRRARRGAKIHEGVFKGEAEEGHGLHGLVGEPDVLVYHEIDEAFSLRARRSRSGGYIFLQISSMSTDETRYLPANRPDAPLQLIQPRRPWHEYSVAHHGERFLILSNAGAENFKLMQTNIAAPGEEYWQEVLPHREDTLLEEVLAFEDFIALVQRRDGLRHIRLSKPDGVSDVRHIPFPEPAYQVILDTNPVFETPILRFQYSSLVTPPSVIDFDTARDAWMVRKVQPVPGGYDASEYTSERLYAPAPDGKQVPISLVYKKGFEKNGSAPVLMTGYGSYGYSSDADFNARRLSLLDRGFAFAIAHIRGGSEMGRWWYEAGRLMHKKNTFTDFIACAEYLVAEQYTNPGRLVIEGGSAGGLLMGAVVNMRPDLFQAVVARVPFCNVISAMLKPDLPLTIVEYEQWGDPHDPAAFAYMRSYSPYENIEAKAYPQIYAKGGLNDLQVPYWDPAKWAAKLRAAKTDANRLVLVTNMGAGHGGFSGRYDALREQAEIYAFVLDAVGLVG